MPASQKRETLNLKPETGLFQNLLHLIKYRISVTVAFSALPGYILLSHKIKIESLLVLCGVLFLASAANALNQIQERGSDALMDRTRNRPLPQQKFTLQQALFITMFLGFTGSALLFFYGGAVPLLLGLFNIVWYNGVYTHLKKITAFAVVPGSLTGAVPPLIGWTAAGGLLFAPEIMILSACIFLWQIPHFWLLQVRYAADYKKGGFPVLADSLADQSIKIITAAWIMAFASSCSLFIFYNLIKNPVSVIMVALTSIFLGVFALLPLFRGSNISGRLMFILINTAMVLLLMILLADILIFQNAMIFLKN